MTSQDTPLWDRTLRRIRQIWPLGDPAALKDLIDANLPDADLPRLRRRIDACLERRGGEVSARARAAELGRAYLVLSSTGRRRFLELLAAEYDVDNGAVEQAIEQRRRCATLEETQNATQRLRTVLEPPRTTLLRQFNELREGVKFLVDLRAELLPWAREDPALKALDRDVLRLLCSWFDVGFLDLRRITWDSPAAILEKLIEYEAVHAIRSWKDLKNRLGNDRRCYAFFHPHMPDEPLIFVEVALVDGIAGNVHDLLDEEAPAGNPEKADTAIFYSISNCQKGLAGVSFGNFLIKRVVADLAAGLPNLKQFSTLSPIPGFIRWLEKSRDELAMDETSETAVDIVLGALESGEDLAALLRNPAAVVGLETGGSLEPVFKRLCAVYLLETRRGSQALDRVAHFHLSNGAMVERINWGANLSEEGLRQSAGMMVNYLYRLPQIEKNHEAYRGQGEITASQAVRRLLRR